MNAYFPRRTHRQSAERGIITFPSVKTHHPHSSHTSTTTHYKHIKCIRGDFTNIRTIRAAQYSSFNNKSDQNTRTSNEMVKKATDLSAGTEIQPKSEPTLGVTKKSTKAGLKDLFMKYGKIAIATHVCLSMCSFASIYAAVSLGVDVDELMEKFGMEFGSFASGSAGTFALALVLNKATSPFRIPITIALTPVIAKKIRDKKDTSQQVPTTTTTTTTTTTSTEITATGTMTETEPTQEIVTEVEEGEQLQTGSDKEPVDVVVGVVWRTNNNSSNNNNSNDSNDSNNSNNNNAPAFLVQQVQSNRAFAGMWELPGGKVEQGEELVHALRRELKEELNINVHNAVYWKKLERYYTYKRLHVRMHFFHVFDYEGSPQGAEGQVMQWHPQQRQQQQQQSNDSNKEEKQFLFSESVLTELETFQQPPEWMVPK